MSVPDNAGWARSEYSKGRRTRESHHVAVLRKSSAQIMVHYRREELVGRQVLAVVNFPKKQVGRFMSEVLVLGFPDENDAIILAQPERAVGNGARLC